MAIHLWRRHKRCSHHRAEYDREFRNCSCLIQAEGLLPGYSGYRCLSTGTRVMAEAERMVFYAEHYGSWDEGQRAVLSGLPLGLPSERVHLSPGQSSTQSASSESKPVPEAIAKFLIELGNPKAKRRQPATVSKYRTLLKRLETFCAERQIADINEITLEDLMDFRDSWPTGPRATANNINRLRSFYKFCLRFKWVEDNFPKKIDCPEGEDVQVQPWEPEEFDLIVRTAESIALNQQQAATNEELVAFVSVMRHTGLRISDASLLTQDRVLPDGTVRLRMEKKKNKKGAASWVTTWLPPEVQERLRKLPLKQGKYFFCHGSTKVETAADLWRRRINAVLREAGLKTDQDKGDSSHRFRHTFAVELLKDGESMENVSKLLGHRNIKTTEDAYAAWVPARQQNLIEAQKARYAAKKKAAFEVIEGKRSA